MSSKLKEPNLPQNAASEFDRRLIIMLYEYLRDVKTNYNLLKDETSAPSGALASDAQHVLANRVFGR
jgi:hypothetical protein